MRYPIVKRFLIAIICIITARGANAELIVNFGESAISGCTPFKVSFYNSTTGASDQATYFWDFGNGTTSTEKNPSAVFVDKRQYKVTLTVYDCAKTLSKTQFITAYNPPAIDFSDSLLNKCLPLKVQFKAITKPGDSSITNYAWNFGDYQYQNGARVTHTYTTAFTPQVSLSATNIYGCSTTITKSDFNTNYQPVVAAFSVTESDLCVVNSQAVFINSSTGPGTLSYLWDFGDGTTSTQASPSHAYSNKGEYTVKLTTTSSFGCSNITQGTSTVNVANFVVDFDVPQTICTGNQVSLTDKSSGTPNDTKWEMDGQQAYPIYYYYNNSYGWTFNDTAAHNIKLTHTYGKCLVSKTKTIRSYETPVVNGFVASFGSVCTTPVTVNFSDTTKDIAVWEWFNDYQSTTVPFVTGRNASYSFNNLQPYNIRLKVTTAHGCVASHSQVVDVSKPAITINAQPIQGDPAYSFCNSSAFVFSAIPAASIKTYQWDFGDNGTDKTTSPKHQYTSEGVYAVTLNYTTTTGCTGQAVYRYIVLKGKPKTDFTVSPGTEVCGNTEVSFIPSINDPSWSYYWNFGDGSGNQNYGSQLTHKYSKDSVYTISLVVVNGVCRDTVVKKGYLTVNPGFVKINSKQNTCNGSRGQVTFTQTSKQINSWTWDFGDGSNTVLNGNSDTMRHIYQKSGTYTATLTGVNSKCTVKDVITVNVLVKQAVQLAIMPTSVCGSRTSGLTISNLDKNPLQTPNSYAYSIYSMQYADLSNAPYPVPQGYITGTSYAGTITGLDNRKQGIMAILSSAYFGCFDTSNIAPLKLTRPAAGFAVDNNSICFKNAMVFRDTSVAGQTSPLKKITWYFGDSSSTGTTNVTNVSHRYTNPGQYMVTQIVTDAAGCADTAYKFVAVSGPKADFSVSQNPVAVNTQVYFYNNTNTYNAYSTTYSWYLPDGTTTASPYASFLFNALSADTVKLITTNNTPACADTTYKIIKVVKNPAFTYTVSYLNGNVCPPARVSFKATDLNAHQVTWNFGDGTNAYDIDSPAHIYSHPGAYKVVFSAYNVSGINISIADTIIIKGPVGAISANKLAACDSLNVELTAVLKDASHITWDFGDGISADSRDTFYYHMYNKAGVFKPRLIVMDDKGCRDTSLLPCKIIIDNMEASISTRPPVICDSTQVNFLVDVKSVAKDELKEPLQYLWDFGNYAYTTDNPDTASYRFTGAGEHKVNFTVSSPYGCTRTITNSFTVQPYSRGAITGPADICANSTAFFTATATNATGDITWHWDFDNNTTVPATQTTPPVLFADSGIFHIRLVVDNKGCFDTAYKKLAVHGGPALYITPKNPVVCLGNSVQLSAHNGTVYSWGYPISAANANNQSQLVTPKVSAWYSVKAEDAYKCTNGDSVFVKVAAPFQLKGDTLLAICPGTKTKLLVAGADKYTWITGTGLSDINIPAPTITTTTAQTYTVVGYDNDGCFNDTASIVVNMAAVPTVAINPRNTTVNAGGDVLLTGNASAGVVSYRWQPADYLSCDNCAAALSTPKQSITYTLTVTNNFGCTATDTTAIKIVCADNLIHIPNAFTPNNDFKNDRFIIAGTGIKLIKHIAIFNRFGTKVFERSNVTSGDETNSWDGTVNSMPVNPGAYVYVTKIECASGEVFDYKGTIVLIR